jgi:hypothetical protein
MRQAITSAAAAATAPVAAAGIQQQQLQPPAQQPPPPQQQQQEGDGFRSVAPLTPQERYVEEEQAANVCLYCPGQLWHLRRCTGEDRALLLVLLTGWALC